MQDTRRLPSELHCFPLPLHFLFPRPCTRAGHYAVRTVHSDFRTVKAASASNKAVKNHCSTRWLISAPLSPFLLTLPGSPPCFIPCHTEAGWPCKRYRRRAVRSAESGNVWRYRAPRRILGERLQHSLDVDAGQRGIAHAQQAVRELLNGVRLAGQQLLGPGWGGRKRGRAPARLAASAPKLPREPRPGRRRRRRLAGAAREPRRVARQWTPCEAGGDR